MLKDYQLLDFVKQNYPKLGTFKKIKQFPHKNINSINYLLINAKKNYVLRNFIDYSNSEKIERICRILNYCIQQKAKVSKSIKNKNNLFVDKKNKLYLTEYYPGHLFSGSQKELTDLAKNIAILHKVLATSKIQYNFRSNQQSYRVLMQLELNTIKNKIRKKKYHDKFDTIVLRNFDFISKHSLEDKKFPYENIRSKYSKQLIHYDLSPGNVIFNKNRVSAIIDFSTMRKDHTITDIAFSSFRFSEYKNSNLDQIQKKMKIFLNSYQKFNSIDKFYLDHFDEYLKHIFLEKIGYIIRRHYSKKIEPWSIDISNYLKYLKTINKMNFCIK